MKTRFIVKINYSNRSRGEISEGYGGVAPPNDQKWGLYRAIFLAPLILVVQALKVSLM